MKTNHKPQQQKTTSKSVSAATKKGLGQSAGLYSSNVPSGPHKQKRMIDNSRYVDSQRTRIQGLTGPSVQLGREKNDTDLRSLENRHGSDVAQRQPFMELRKIRANYAQEQTVQRPDLIGAIKGAVDRLKMAHKAYDDAFKAGEGFEKLNELMKERTYWYTFLRKQDVEVTEEGDFDETSLEDRLVEYDKTPEAQARTQIKISGGKFKRHDDQNVDTKDSVTFQTGMGWEIFVMSPGGDIHMASHKIGKYHHSSLLAGGNVAGAGTMKVSAGSLKAMNNKSGHYQPEETHIRQVVKRLQTQNVPLDFNLEILGGVFNGKAEDYMTGGGDEKYGFKTTKVFVLHYIKVKGRDAVKKAFTDLGWQCTDDFGITKRDGHKPSHKEVRDVLTARFKDEPSPAPVVT